MDVWLILLGKNMKDERGVHQYTGIVGNKHNWHFIFSSLTQIMSTMYKDTKVLTAKTKGEEQITKSKTSTRYAAS